MRFTTANFRQGVRGHLGWLAGRNVSGASEGLHVRKSASPTPLALAGDSAPGVPGRQFEYFYNAVMNQRRQLAFLAKLDESTITNHGIWTGGAQSHLRMMARTGDTAPGTGGQAFCHLGSPRLNAIGQIAFVADVLPSGLGYIETGTTRSGKRLAVISSAPLAQARM